MLVYRAGNENDNKLEKGFWWSNTISQVEPYFKGKIAIAEIEFDESFQKKFILTKELKKFGHHNGYGVMWRTNNDTYEDEYYYYISPEYMKNNMKIIKIATGKEAEDIVKNGYKEKVL